MKHFLLSAGLVAVFSAMLLTTSCEKEASEETAMPEFITGIRVSGEDIDISGLDTKVSYDSGLHFSWTEGDKLGIFPIGGQQVAFPLSDVGSGSSANFDGGAWALRSNYEYAAYYPYSTAKSDTEDMTIPVTYVGQTQTRNNSTSHLGSFAYLASEATKPDSHGSVNLKMKAAGCIIRITASMASGIRLTDAVLQDLTGKMIVGGVIDLSKKNTGSGEYVPVIEEPVYASSISFKLKTFTTSSTSNTNNVTLYFWMAPQKLSGHKLNLRLTDSNYNVYNFNMTCTKDLVAGQAKGLDFGTYINPDAIESVDLGLSVRWATCNIGAANPEDFGLYFQWGSIEGYGMNSNDGMDFDWAKYPHSTGAEGTMTKYCLESSGGTVDGHRTLLPADDAATQIWGGKWRMPTSDECLELLGHNLDRTVTTVNGVSGIKITSRVPGYEGNSIFIPSSYARIYTNSVPASNSDCMGAFWSSSVYVDGSSSNSNLAFALEVRKQSNGNAGVSVTPYQRFLGLTVRPVMTR